AELESLQSIRVTVSAGERLYPQVESEWADRFLHPILNGYGTTEIGHIFISQTLDDRISGSVGCSIPGFEVDIVDSFGCPRACGDPGLLRVRGPVPVSCYYRDEEASLVTFVGQHVLTSDIAVLSVSGQICVSGRATDITILRSGRIVRIAELED